MNNHETLREYGIDSAGLIEGSACASLWANCYTDTEEGITDLDSSTCEALGFQIDANELWSEEARAIVSDVIQWAVDNVADVLLYMKQTNRDENHVGHDFALTRAGHLTGLWDRGADHDLGDRLSVATKPYGPGDLFVTLDDDGDVTEIGTF